MPPKSAFSLLLFAFSAIGNISCKKDNTVTTPVLSEFVGETLTGNYFIKDDPASTFKIPVGTTTLADMPRTITFEVSSPTGAIPGQQYNISSNSVTIPAGTAVDSITLTGIYAGFPTGRIDTLLFTITGGDVPIFEEAKTYVLILQKYCDFLLSDFEGFYNAMDNGNYGPYDVEVLAGSAMVTELGVGTMQLGNLWDYGVPTVVKVDLDWKDPSRFTASIPEQVFVAADDLWIKNSATPGTFSSCNQTFTLRYTLYVKSTGEIYAADQVTELTR